MRGGAVSHMSRISWAGADSLLAANYYRTPQRKRKAEFAEAGTRKNVRPSRARNQRPTWINLTRNMVRKSKARAT